jgi:hypothetical protein
VNFSFAFNRVRISRSLVTILVLTLVQTIGGPVFAPKITAPKAKAVEVPYASYTSGIDVVIPAGVFSITLVARGGVGGAGGNDGGALGLGSSNVGLVQGTFNVSPGDRITMYPGSAGGNGASTANNSGGGSAGVASIPTGNPINTLTPSVKFNGSWSSVAFVNGGVGGNAGSYGTSGAGGGGGAASVILINENVAIVAAGGGGGAGGSGAVASANGNYTSNGSARGGDGGYGGGCGNNGDGGGGGGGGGGWQGGTGGSVDRPSGGECRGFGGSRGANFLWDQAIPNLPSNLNEYRSPITGAAGTINYVLNYSATTSCSTDVQTVDIYTVVKVTNPLECTWSVPSTVSVVDLFMVGGGSGGSGDAGGGGSGGAALSRSAIAVTPNSTMTLKVGYGGAATAWGFTSDAFAGDSTTVRISSGTLFSALGGTKPTSGPGQAGGAGGVAGNGGFSGGAGGQGGTCGNFPSANAGSPGKTGVSNYFYGIQNTYAGGGGGGSCPNGATNTAAAGSNGGGAGGYASEISVNQPGANATSNSGSGGGGGTAAGPGLRLIGGKGGSGVILIRYARDTRYEFPSSLTSSLSYRYLPGDLQTLDSSRLGWIDSTGQKSSTSDLTFRDAPTITTQGTTDNSVTVRSSKSLLTAAGTTAQGVFLPALPSNYTLFHLARYQRGDLAGRIVSATGTNWLSGFWSGNQGVAWHGDAGSWLMPSLSGTDYSWQLSADQTSLYKSNGLNLTRTSYSGGTNPASGFGINVGWANSEYSKWQVADLMVFNRALTLSEISSVENYMSLVYGLASPPNPIISPPSANESGLLVKLDGSNSSSLSDTSTVWNDSSGNSRNANINSPSIGAIWGQGSVTCTSPRRSAFHGGSLSFNGSSDCAFISGSAALNLETYTVEVWVNPRLGVTQTGGAAIITTPYTEGNDVNFALHYTGGSSVNGGFYRSGGVWQSTGDVSVIAGEWTHLALVATSGSLSLFKNGELVSSVPVSGRPAGSSRGIVLGRRWDGTQHFNGLISQVRLLSTGLTSAQVRQNFYQSSSRYSTTASGVVSPTGTYGQTLTQVFTATSGFGTKTFSFSPNNRSAITWDTSTANVAVLGVAPTITAGSYLETITVTDSESSTTLVALTIIINKARQATLLIGQYEAYPNISTYPLNVYGGSTFSAVTRSIVDTGTAGCVLTSNLFLTASKVGTCTVRAVKDGDVNYLAETTTATIIWIAWSANYAVQSLGGNHAIPLSGGNQFTARTETVTASAFSNTSGGAISSATVGTTIRINSTGFAGLNPSQITATFRPYEDGVVTAVTSTYVEVVVPAGAATGVIALDSPRGVAYTPSFTISP